MRLVPITAEDEQLTVRLECDPEIMVHIGGPRPEAEARAAHRRRLELMGKGDAYMVKILADDSNEVLGTIGMWKIDGGSPQTYEIGWIVAPKHQGKGVATEAAHRMLKRARSNPSIRYVNAFPAVSNGASNAIARKIGMTNQGAIDHEGFAGVMRCNDWCIDLDQVAD